MTLKEYGIKLRNELLKDCSEATVLAIAQKINNLKVGGNPITDDQKEILFDSIRFEHTSNGKNKIKESDNSSWIKAMDLLKQKLSNNGKN